MYNALNRTGSSMRRQTASFCVYITVLASCSSAFNIYSIEIKLIHSLHVNMIFTNKCKYYKRPYLFYIFLVKHLVGLIEVTRTHNYVICKVKFQMTKLYHKINY